MMQNIALEKNIPCGFFSLEMPYESIGMRILSQEARVPMHKMRSGMLKFEDVKKIQDAAGRWYEAPLYTVDTPNMKLLELRAMARRMVKNHKVKLSLVEYCEKGWIQCLQEYGIVTTFVESKGDKVIDKIRKSIA